MNTQDLRKEHRIPANELPPEYTRFTILLGHEHETEVQTADLSLGGFGFITDRMIDDFIQGSRLVLYPLGRDQSLYGIVVHATTTDKGTRVGVQLQELGGYQEYRTAIQKILHHIDRTNQS